MDPRQLREATRAEHEATEQLMPLTGEPPTRESYIRTLEVLFPIVSSWEIWAKNAAPESLQPMLASRQRSPMLRRDLAVLGAATPQGVESPALWAEVLGENAGDVQSPRYRASFLGALYVMEGSTLGGRFIARQMEPVLGLSSGEGLAYFQGHGEATGAMWRDVLAQLAAVPQEDAPLVIEAAKRAFRAFGQALEARVSASETMHG